MLVAEGFIAAAIGPDWRNKWQVLGRLVFDDDVHAFTCADIVIGRRARCRWQHLLHPL